MESDTVRISKKMSAILRHRAIDKGLAIDDGGWVPLDDFLRLPEMRNVSISMVKHIVDTNDKRRFALETRVGKQYIRCNQGHSKELGSVIKEDVLLKKITEPLPLCLHGTNDKALPHILKSGLKPMGRTHIHMASNFPGKVTSGARYNCRIFIEVDMSSAMKDGIQFYESQNGVILCSDTIEPKYFTTVHRL